MKTRKNIRNNPFVIVLFNAITDQALHSRNKMYQIKNAIAVLYDEGLLDRVFELLINDLTLLTHAVSTNDTDIVRFLLNAKARPNALNDTGDTPLTCAVRSGFIDVTRLLLRHKAHPDYFNSITRETPLFLAAEANDLETLTLLLEAKANTNLHCLDTDTTPLCWAASKNRDAVAGTLLDWNADADLASPVTGATALTTSAQAGHASIVGMLLRANATVNCVNTICLISPLAFASANGHVETVKILLDAKADIELGKIPRRKTPLMFAVNNEHCEVVKLLLEEKAEPDTQEFMHYTTALFYAAKRNNLFIAELLLQAKADPTLGNRNISVINFVFSKDNYSMVMLLQKYNRIGIGDFFTCLSSRNQCDYSMIPWLKLFLVNSENTPTHLPVRIMLNADMYLKKLETAHDAFAQLIWYIYQCTNIFFPKAVVQIVLEYENRIYEPKPSLISYHKKSLKWRSTEAITPRLFVPCSVNPVLKKLKKDIAKQKGSHGFFDSTLEKIDEAIELKNETPQKRRGNLCRVS